MNEMNKKPNMIRPYPPKGKVDIILDTDTYNEIDDQFAVCYMMLSPEKFNVKGICAAPFFNERSTGPCDGMEKSYNELLKIFSLLGREKDTGLIHKGATKYLDDENTPVDCDASHFIAETAEKYTPENPLYVAAIGAITNVASAFIEKPEIADRVVVVWLGGHGRDFEHTKEFNLIQDVAAARVVFSSGARVVQLPGMGVVSELLITMPELELYIKGKNALCDYLYENVRECNPESYKTRPWGRVIWDVAAIAWFFGGEMNMMSSRFDRMLLPSYSGIYENNIDCGFLEYVYKLRRDEIFNHLFKKLTAFKIDG